MANVWNGAIERVDISLEASLVLIVVEILDCCLLKRPCRSNAIHHGVTNLVQAKF